MCLKFWNWPVQRQQNQLPSNPLPSNQRAAVAIYTSPLAESTGTVRRQKVSEDDLRFVREIFPSARNGPAIVSASENAWASGVRSGMPLAEARSMSVPLRPTTTRSRSRSTTAQPFEETLFFEWAPAKDRAALVDIAEATRRFSPIVGLDEMPVPDSLLLDITGCGMLFGGESSLAEQLIKRLNARGLLCSAVVSDSVATAWAFAHPRGHFLMPDQRISSRGARRGPSSAGDTDWDLPIVIIPPGQSKHWLHPLPVSAARIPYSDIQTLSQLGILTLKQLFGLPIEDLPSRLSAVAIQRLHQISGVDDESIAAIPEANPVSARWASEFPATNRDEVRQVVAHLIGEIAEQLQRRAVGAVRISCQLKQESGDSMPLTGDIVKPLQSGADLFEILNIRLDALRVDKPIVSVQMTATVASLPVARQKDLFSVSEHVNPAEELSAVLNRLTNRLGKTAVLTAEPNNDPIPENGIRLRPLVNDGEETTNGRSAEIRIQELVMPDNPVADRAAPQNHPLCLLSSPVKIADSQSSPLTNDFTWNGQTHAVAASRGPERIQTQWWHDTAVHRDYYRVTSSQGSEFWIFRELNSGDWFLHGIFE